MNDNIAEGFHDESTRCRECMMIGGDHDPMCPNNPALNAGDPMEVLIRLEAELNDLECADDPDFEAIADLATRIESIRSHITQSKQE